jgi:hypothetical protein
MLTDVLPRQGVNGAAIVDWLNRVVLEAGSYIRDANAYVSWVHDLERKLREFFSDAPVERLYGDRFWHIHAESGVRMEETRRQEMEAQLHWLKELLESVKAMQARFGAPQASIGVLDTNALLHSKPLTEIDWRALLGAENVRLVAPLRVIDELDAKKAARRDDLRRRAANRVRHLAGLLLGDASGEVRPGVSIEAVGLYEFDPSLYRQPSAPPDVEILDTCEALAAYAGINPVKLVTGDLGMKILAQARGVHLKEMPEEYRLPLAEGD